jgi:hypothetical protein
MFIKQGSLLHLRRLAEEERTSRLASAGWANAELCRSLTNPCALERGSCLPSAVGFHRGSQGAIWASDSKGSDLTSASFPSIFRFPWPRNDGRSLSGSPVICPQPRIPLCSLAKCLRDSAFDEGQCREKDLPQQSEF